MPVRTKPYKFSSAGLTDVGLVRANNEDVWGQIPKKHFYVIADGMGGHQAGEVAAREAVSLLCDYVTKNLDQSDDEISLEEARHLVIESIEESNAHVYKMSRTDSDLRGMGTTICCLLFHPKGLIYGHVGDSRIYRLRNKRLFQMTKDHSLMRELLDLGQLGEKHSADFQYRNIITKAVGTESTVEPSVRISPISADDLYLLCTDGLSDMLSRDEMESILNTHTTLPKLAQGLIQAAKNKGGQDNITVVLVKVQEEHGSKDLSR